MQVRRILWGALFASTFMYLAVVVTLPSEATEPPDPTFAMILAVLGLGSATLGFFLPEIVRKQTFATLRFETTEAERFGDVPAGTKFFADPARARATAQSGLQTPFILRMALFESIALYGLVLAFLRHPPFVYAGFFVLTWALMALQFPTESGDDAAITRATGIRFR